MEETSMLEFRRRVAAIIRRVQKGLGMILTHRGKPAIRLEPFQASEPEVSPTS